MKRYFNRTFSFILAMSIFLSYSLTAYAFPKRLLDGTWVDVPLSELGEEVSHFISYGLNQLGVVIQGGNFEQWLKNNETYKDLYDDNGRLAKNIVVDTETGNVTYKKELMSVLKNAVDDYAKENEPYYIVPVPSYKDIDPAQFDNKSQYNTVCNMAKKYGLIGVNGYSSGMTVSDLSNFYKDGCAFVYMRSYPSNSTQWATTECWAYVYDSNWNRKNYYFYQFYPFDSDSSGYTSLEQGKYAPDGGFNETRHMSFCINYTLCNNGSIRNDTSSIYTVRDPNLISDTGGRVRVYNTVDDFKQYSVGKRSVYYTENYYNYVPEDLTTSIDDLQKSVDDLQDVVDKLTDQIGNDTSESEIEELLKQILDELKNNPGSGGSGGGGSGDIGDVSDKLSGIYTVVSHIFTLLNQSVEKLQTSVDSILGEIRFSIKELLDEILAQIKKIKHWTIADTVIDGVTGVSDIITDWADFIKDMLSDAENGAETAVGAISSVMGDTASLMKTKFPFCVPWDVYLLIGFLAEEPETPVFRLPIKIERYGIEEYIEVDMSQFTAISTLSRTLLTVMYCYALLNLTMKIFPIAKEDN